MITIFVALKHINGRKRQSIVAISSVVIAMVVLVVSIGIASGLDKQMIKSMLSIMPDIKVYNSTMNIKDYNGLSDKIIKIKGVKGVIPQYSTQGIIKFEGNTGNFVSGIMIKGIDQKNANNALELNKELIKGTYNFNKLNTIVVGKELFKELGAKLGDVVKIISPENKALYLKITGIFYTGYYDYDSKFIFIPLKTAQILSDSGNIVTNLNVKLKDVYQAKKISKEIEKKTGYMTSTWGELNKNILYALSLEKTVMILVLSLIVFVSGFVLAVVLNTTVKEKTRDIGIMRAIGFSKSKIMRIFMLEGLIIGAIGIIIGTCLSFLILGFLEKYSLHFLIKAYYLTKIPVEVTLKDYFGVLIEIIIIIIIFTFVPAYRASKLYPVEALKYE